MKIQFKEEEYLPITRLAGVEILFPFIYFSEKENRSSAIKVTITDVVANNWGFSIWSPNPKEDYKELAKIALANLVPRFQKLLLERPIQDQYNIILDSTNSPVSHGFNTGTLSFVSAFSFEIGQAKV